MTPYTFRKSDSQRGKPHNPDGKPSTRRTLNFRDGRIVLSTLLAEQLGVTSGSHIAFTYDENKPERIYVRTADYHDDTKDIQSALAFIGTKKKVLRCCNTAVVQHVLQQAGAINSCTCYVAQKPTVINGKKHYQILVASPVMIN